jgi:hypothetical protein
MCSRDMMLLLQKLPPTQICNLKFSATHRNTIPFNFFFFLLFFDSVLSSLLFFFLFYNSNRGADSRWNNTIYINGGDQQLEEQKKHKVTVPIKMAIGFFLWLFSRL